MYVEGGWKPPNDPPRRPPRLSDRDERTLMWLVMAGVAALLIAPIGGGTIVQAVVAALKGG